MSRNFLRPLAAVAALTGLSAYATIMLRGPQGVTALQEKRQEVRTLEEQNANLQRDIDAKKLRIERLKHDKSTQELEVRKRLKMDFPGNTTFILPQDNQAKSSGPAASGDN